MQLDFPPVKTILNVYEALFNYLSVAVGDGKGTVHPFNVYEFAARFRFFVPTALNAIKILQTNGYLILTDESDNPPRDPGSSCRATNSTGSASTARNSTT